ncbi:E3 ubiquitin-protein ligase RHF2A-like isoform X1 [Juglans microcarpa x Juglans regia]|uniref:E3 ubiquitin-protein ligase RHF2A-like isoform X1 n=2 Tax=Juglans microcarpa x Juglans regia TaxID=2249226 RepID=UPI001B7DC407|nr:E3 ubiquitin-protein ligase RHF2A-like isoform X1 [Juglans microcarpa x Juglans regia]XP_041028453.1 E3 ubiquitin-protein ligase RHF2A-like isoform X1 [Juglans microcarpa x Juglans regia]
MEVLEMEEAKPESHMTSAAAFVEGGIQQACDDACSICLEDFSESDPSTVTTCKHEFHLQCILEWCQRSSQCPMCWQHVSLKDPTSQELLEAVVRERSFRVTPARNATIFHHPTLGDFELQHLPVGANDAELEERIIQHLAAAAAMGRAHHIGRREGQRSRSAAHGRPHFLVFSAHPSGPSGPVSAPRVDNEPASISVAGPSTPLASGGDVPSQQFSHFPSAHTDQDSSPASGSAFLPTNRQGISSNNRSPASHSSTPNPDRAGPSDFQSFSESLKSRFNAMSMRYKESLSKNTRGWKERLFSRNTSMSDIGSEVQREVNAGIASLPHMMERLETRDDSTASHDSEAYHLGDSSVTNQNIVENDSNRPASCAASSTSG